MRTVEFAEDTGYGKADTTWRALESMMNKALAATMMARFPDVGRVASPRSVDWVNEEDCAV